MDSDPNFSIFRRFGYIRSRVILNQQDVLRELEDGLDSLDDEDASVVDQKRLLCCRELDETERQPLRKELFSTIASELEVYGSSLLLFRWYWSDVVLDKLILRTAAVLKLAEPDPRNKQSIARFICNDGQLRRPDRDFIQHADDLVGLSGDKEHSWVHSMIERLCTRHSRKLSKVSAHLLADEQCLL